MGREEVRFGVGGDECAAWLYRPQRADGRVPAVVLGTGISCVRGQALDAFAERFAAAGYAALAFDYRHFGDSGGEPRQLLSMRLQREDWLAAISVCRALEGIDRDRLALWGYSLGGGHVQYLAATETGIGAAVCVAPVVDSTRTLLYAGGPGNIARLTAAGLRDRWRALRRAEPYRVPVVGAPGSLAVLTSPEALAGITSITPPGSTWRNEVCARAALDGPYRLAKKARRIACPVLYCIAEADDINPPELGKQAAEAAPDGELRTYPGGHFTFRDGEVLERLVAAQIDFLERRL